MPELTLNISITPEDLAKLQDLPGQITQFVETTRNGLDAVLSGSDTSNPLGALVHNLPSIAEQAANIPGIDGVVHTVNDLLAQLPATSLADAAAVGRSIEQALQIFGPVVEAIRDGGLEQGLERALSRAQEASSNLLGNNAEFAQISRELEEFFRLFRAMLNWGRTPPRPEDVADLLSRALIGVAPDLLAAPVAALDAALQPLEAALPQGNDLTQWRSAATQQIDFWRGLDAQLSASATIDWPALEVHIQAAQSSLLNLIVVRDRLLATTIGNINRLRLDGLNAVAAALDAVPRIQPTRMTPIFDGLRLQLQGMVDELTEWNPTPDELRLLVRQKLNDLFSAIDQSPLGDLRRLMIDFQQRLLRTIESLPFADLAHEAETALRRVAESLTLIDPEAVRRPIHEFFENLRNEIEQLGGDDVKNAIGELWSGVESAFDDVALQLESLRDALQGSVDSIKQFVQSTQRPLQQINDLVNQIKAVLNSFDLNQPTEEVIAELHRLRDTVAAIDVSNLPAPAVDAIKQAAEVLRQIDITGAVRGPLDEALGQVDPTPLLQQAAASLTQVTDQLKMLDPGSIVGELDKPVDELLKTLSAFGPERIERLLLDALEPVKAPIRQLDFSALLAPLTRLYADLTTRIDAILDPDLIFEPLEALYQPVIDLVDSLDPARLMDLFTPHVEGLSGNVGQSAGPPSSIASQGGVLREQLSSPVNIDDELFGFRPGDLLIPLIDLHHKLMEIFDALDNTVLEPAARLLQQNFSGRLSALDPAAASARVRTTLTRLQDEFSTTIISTRLADAAIVYGAVVAKIMAGASLNLSTADAAVAARVTARLPELSPLRLLPDLAQHDALVSATVRVEASANVDDLRSAYAGVTPQIRSLLPSFVNLPTVSAQALRDALRSLDPAPIRDDVNALFDQVGQKIIGLQAALMAAIDEFGRAAEEFLLPITPGNLLTLASRLHAAAREQIVALSPATFKDEVQLIFDVIKRQLSILDPSPIIGEIVAVRDQLLETLDTFVRALLPDTAPFDELMAQLAAFKPSQILAPLVESLKPLSDLVKTIDPRALLEPLIAAIARVREQVPDVLARIEAAFDEVLGAFPEGGFDRVNVTVEVS